MIITVKRLHVGGMAIFPFILLRANISAARLPVLLNHERIHIRQQIELLVIPFYVTYLFSYLFNLIRFRNHKQAYRNIIFEREAFANESNLDYLKSRRVWSFLNY